MYYVLFPAGGGGYLKFNVLWKRPLIMRKDAGCDAPSAAKEQPNRPKPLRAG